MPSTRGTTSEEPTCIPRTGRVSSFRSLSQAPWCSQPQRLFVLLTILRRLVKIIMFHDKMNSACVFLFFFRAYPLLPTCVSANGKGNCQFFSFSSVSNDEQCSARLVILLHCQCIFGYCIRGGSSLAILILCGRFGGRLIFLEYKFMKPEYRYASLIPNTCWIACHRSMPVGEYSYSIFPLCNRISCNRNKYQHCRNRTVFSDFVQTRSKLSYLIADELNCNNLC